MIKLAYPEYTLADAIEYLKDEGYSIVKYISKDQLAHILAVDPMHQRPVYQSVQVFLRSDKATKIHLIHSNLGYIFFKNEDVLDRYSLKKPEFYFDYQINNEPNQHQHDAITFSDQGNPHWKATFDYATIFDHFGLNGNDDYAPFVGFFIQSEDT